MPSKFIAAYLRVSTDRQSTASQRPEIDNWLAVNSGKSEVQRFEDSASGRTFERPGWKALQAALEGGQVSTLVVWRVDRLGRTAAGLTRLFALLADKGVNLVSIKDGLDLVTPAGRLMANVLASVAEFENEIRRERIIAGQAKARAEGKRIGGSKPGRRIKVTEDVERSVVKLFKAGESKATIARTVGLSRPTVYRVLRNHGLLESA